MMTRFHPDAARPGRRARASLAVVLLALIAGAYACAPKITKIDPSYSMPEGKFSPNAQMIVWRDEPTTAYIFKDVAPADPDSMDILQTTREFERYSPNVLQGMIFDHTPANEFQLFRRERGGGVRQFVNFTAPRTRQWLAAQVESFHFVDPSPSGYSPASYVGRGIVQGLVNAESPLTNLATPPVAPLANIELQAVWWNNKDASRGPLFTGPKIKLRWDPVPGAVRYILHVYRFRGDLHSDEERYLSGTPAPFYDGQSTDLYFGYVPSNVNFMFVGDSSRTDLTTITTSPLVNGSPYLVRLAALDASGHMIAMTMGETNPLEAFSHGFMGLVRNIAGNNTFMLYRLGATIARDTVVTGGGGGGGFG